ncbi:MAG TPA: VanZ family protein [Thermoanaerobaculia bacterium]|nr:VanZ family protein [Thermoanaerobaculia bacterium]
MGKREVRVVVVPKRVTALLLVLVSAAMVALLYFLSGKAYVLDSHPAAEVVRRLLRRDDPSRTAILVALMPVIANALFFVPWGFLMFIVLDAPRRPRRRTYLITVVAAATFATGMELWQIFLPTRVTSAVDAAANTLGALAGAMAGHLRKEINVRFEH